MSLLNYIKYLLNKEIKSLTLLLAPRFRDNGRQAHESIEPMHSAANTSGSSGALPLRLQQYSRTNFRKLLLASKNNIKSNIS